MQTTSKHVGVFLIRSVGARGTLFALDVSYYLYYFVAASPHPASVIGRFRAAGDARERKNFWWMLDHFSKIQGHPADYYGGMSVRNTFETPPKFEFSCVGKLVLGAEMSSDENFV